MKIGVVNSYNSYSFKGNSPDKYRHKELMQKANRDRSIREDYYDQNYSTQANAKRKREARMQYIMPIASTVVATAVALGAVGAMKDSNQEEKYPIYVPQPTAIVTPAPTQEPTPYEIITIHSYENYQIGLDNVIADIETKYPEFRAWIPTTSYTVMNNELNKVLNGDFSTTEDRMPHLKNYISAHLLDSFFLNLESTNRYYEMNGLIHSDTNIVDEVTNLCLELTNGEVSPNLVLALMNQTSRGLLKDNQTGATGLMQVSEVAEEHMNKKYFSSNPRDRHEPLDNIALGIKYIHYLQNELESKYTGEELIQRIVIGYKDGHTYSTKDFSQINANTMNYAQRTNCFYNCLNEIKE